MKTIAITVQRDLLGQVAEYTLILVDGEKRWPLESADRLPAAQIRAGELRREHRAAKVTLEAT